MMDHHKRAAMVGLCTLVAAYLLAAFVQWDLFWVDSIATWTPPGRIFALLWLLFIPGYAASFPIIFRRRTFQ